MVFGSLARDTLALPGLRVDGCLASCRRTSAPPGAPARSAGSGTGVTSCLSRASSPRKTACSSPVPAGSCFRKRSGYAYDRDRFRAGVRSLSRVTRRPSRGTLRRRRGFVVRKRRHSCDSHGVFCASRSCRSRRSHHARWQRHQRQVQPHTFRYAARSLVNLGQVDPGGWADAVLLGPGHASARQPRLAHCNRACGTRFLPTVGSVGSARTRLRARRRPSLSRLRGAQLLALAA